MDRDLQGFGTWRPPTMTFLPHTKILSPIEIPGYSLITSFTNLHQYLKYLRDISTVRLI